MLATRWYSASEASRLTIRTGMGPPSGKHGWGDQKSGVEIPAKKKGRNLRVRSCGRIQKRIWRHGFFGFAVFNGNAKSKKGFITTKTRDVTLL